MSPRQENASSGKNDDQETGVVDGDSSAPSRPTKEDTRIGDRSSWSAAGVLLLLLPASIVCSLLLLTPFRIAWPSVYWVAFVYYAAGFVLVIPRVHDAFFIFAFRDGREPEPHEAARIEKAWSAVIEHSGRSDGDRYKFKVLDTEEFNAMAGGGHIVFVTTTALEATDDEALRGLLAHELGHHVGLHPIALSLEIWIMRPVIWAHLVSVALVNFAMRVWNGVDKRRTGTFVTVILFLSLVLNLLMRAVAFILGLIAQIAFFVLRFVGRSAEYRADRYAAQIGFGIPLVRILAVFGEYEQKLEKRHKRSISEIIGSTHPPSKKRVRRLEEYLKRSAELGDNGQVAKDSL